MNGAARMGAEDDVRRLTRVLDTPLFRLQCSEGIDTGEALYEWTYPRQLLGIRLAEARAGHGAGHASTDRDPDLHSNP
ncbi:MULTISPECIES: hypothetical protein [Cryobacterium]|uniref:hypothetical protein n=1 Tax=Cryobacterium TaxID=69578 RepID=UPI001F540EAF|nr:MULTISPECIES: hypothetical protein [Cryobacterium]